jgi:multidrug resistance efflux pump
LEVLLKKEMKFKLMIIILALSGFAMAACSGNTALAEEPEVSEIPIVIADTKIVSDGNLVPRDFVDLAFSAGGEVAEVLVDEGDQLSVGDVIARLSGRERLEASISAARLEIQAAEQELLAAQVARTNLDEDLAKAQTAALDLVTQTKEAVRTAERQVRYWSSTGDQADIDEAQATVILARDALEKAQDKYEPYEDKSENNLVRANLLGKLARAQQQYDDAVRRLNNLQGVIGNEFDLAQAESQLKIAQSRLDEAQSDYEELLEGPDLDAVKLADSRISTAEARLASAEQALKAAEATLSDLDLVATIDSVVVDLDLTPGEQVSPGRPVVTLADFSQWYVETDNLTEIEVVDISLGQDVTIMPDSLPELTLNGKVETIKDKFVEKRGDVTYTTRIILDDIDPRLRWGMTVVVNFEN